jgi:hypothetical protein
MSKSLLKTDLQVAVEKIQKKYDEAKPVKATEDVLVDADATGTIMYGLNSIKTMMQLIRADINSGLPGRDTIQNLKDCMMLLFEVQKKEREMLEDLSDEDLAKIANKQK